MSTLNKTESSSVMASHFLRDLQNHPPRRLDNDRDSVRKSLDAILPASVPTKAAPRRMTTHPVKALPAQSPLKASRPKKDRSLWLVGIAITVISLAVVGDVAWSLRDAPPSTFWGGVGFFAALLGSTVIVSLWGLAGSVARDPDVEALMKDIMPQEEERNIPLFPVIGFDFLRYDELNPND